MSVKAPLLFHHMPEPFKLLVFRKHLGPAPGWVPREYVEKHVAMKLGQPSPASAKSAVARSSHCAVQTGPARSSPVILSLRRPDIDQIFAGLPTLDVAFAEDCAASIIRQFSTGSSNLRYLGFTSLAWPRQTVSVQCCASPTVQGLLPDASQIIFIAQSRRTGMLLGFRPSLRLRLGKIKAAPTEIGVRSLDEILHTYCRLFPFFWGVTHLQPVW